VRAAELSNGSNDASVASQHQFALRRCSSSSSSGGGGGGVDDDSGVL